MVTNLTNTCPYATMCGWCSKWDKECDRKIGAATPTKINTETKVQDISVSPTDSATATSSYPKKCGYCVNRVTDTSSSIVRLKCLISGRLHFHDDICDCDTITATN